MDLNSEDKSPIDLRTLRTAFDAACQELGIGQKSLDVPMRERLVACILRLARQGERDAAALQRQAVLYFRNVTQREGSDVQEAEPLLPQPCG
jgi:hypothetical protein